MGHPEVRHGSKLERFAVGERKYIRLPLHTRRFTMWGALRRWKSRNRAYHNFNNTYCGKTLLGQIDAGRVSPVCLDDWAFLKPIRAAILGWVALACKVRNAYGLKMTRAQWGIALHCHPNTFDLHKKYLIEQGWLRQIDDFRPGRFRGRDGTYKHRRETNWYAPGWRLERAWERFQRRERKKVEPIPRHPSATGEALDQFCDPSGSDCEKQSLTRVPRAKEAPAGPVVEKPTPSASGADGPVKESAAPTRIEKRPAGAADQDKIASGVPPSRVAVHCPPADCAPPPPSRPVTVPSSADRTPEPARPSAETRRRVPASKPQAGPAARLSHKRDAMVHRISGLGFDIKTQRELIAIYDRTPDMVDACIDVLQASASARGA